MAIPSDIQGKVQRLFAQVDKLTLERDSLTTETEEVELNVVNLDEAITILTAVLSVTQDGVIEFIENVVGTALEYVYGGGYGFRVVLEQKRNQPEVSFFPTKNGRFFNVKYGCGVGVVDVCSFALRLALWAISEPRTEPVLIFDEPFRHVHGDAAGERLGAMVQRLSELLGIQIIIVSGESALTSYADKSFLVWQDNGESKVGVQSGNQDRRGAHTGIEA